MSQMPIAPTTLDKILRAVGAVRTKGGIAALDLILVFSFGIGVLMFVNDMNWGKLSLILVIFLCWQISTVYFFIKLPQSRDLNERQERITKEKKK